MPLKQRAPARHYSVPTTRPSAPGGGPPPSDEAAADPEVDSPEAFLNRELSWLGFARRVISLIENREIPLLERVNFCGIAGMLHDEFFMKRISGIKRQIRRGRTKTSVDGRTSQEEFDQCQQELLKQVDTLAQLTAQELLPALEQEGLGILDYDRLSATQREAMRAYFEESVRPILTPLAVDSEHPFPFISNLGLNLAVPLPDPNGGRERFVRIKVPNNRPRWVPLPGGDGFTPLEQVIAHNLDLLFPESPPTKVYLFRVTRGADGEPEQTAEDDDSLQEPGGIVQQVSNELKARRFAGVVRLQVDVRMPQQLGEWLAGQLKVDAEDVYAGTGFMGLSDFLKFEVTGREDLRYLPHRPVTHPRLRHLDPRKPGAVFDEIARGDVLLHHPYHNFDTSVLRFIESSAADPSVLGIKLTIYRTSSDSPIVRALAEAAKLGKQVAVLVEITARFDEAPNIAWGKFLENEGVHVSYGVERLKTHVKLALVVREEGDHVRSYAHFGTGNYHPGTARLYEDLGILTCNPAICEEVAEVFNSLTGTTPYNERGKILIAPVSMRRRFDELIRREAEHAKVGRPSGIDAKMNQLQDADIIGELYAAGRAGVPITLNVRGLCCLRPGVPGLSESIRVFSVLGRFLEHSRVFRFRNGGEPEYFMGSADWMRRNLKNRIETVVPVLDEQLKRALDAILDVYQRDNCSAWDCQPDGSYTKRSPAPGEERREVQEMLIELAKG
jgi:polyphosphate kinase